MALTIPEVRAALKDMAASITAAGPATLTKGDLQAAVEGIDGYLDANAASINTAIPLPARNALTNSQKAALVSFVALRRYGG